MEKRRRPIGICSGCGLEKELRQREPEPLCGACYERWRRKEMKDANPLAFLEDGKKRQRKVRTELMRILNALDALAGHLPVKDLEEISQIVKVHLAPLVSMAAKAGHGDSEELRDRDPDAGGGDALAPEDTSVDATPADETFVDDRKIAASDASAGAFAPKHSTNDWWSKSLAERRQIMTERSREVLARKRAENNIPDGSPK